MTDPQQVAEIWMKSLSDGAFAIGFFNRTPKRSKLVFPGAGPRFMLHQDLGRRENFTAELWPHGCVLLRVSH
jgi:hypothetical protein